MASRAPFDWFLPQWMATLDITHARLMELTAWDKRKTSQLINGKQPFKRDSLSDAAYALHLAPYELLMHPDDAMALRRMRESALQIAAEAHDEYRAEPRAGNAA